MAKINSRMEPYYTFPALAKHLQKYLKAKENGGEYNQALENEIDTHHQLESHNFHYNPDENLDGVLPEEPPCE